MLLAKIGLRTDARASTNQRTLLASDEPFADGAAKVAGFSLHAGVAARADERKKLERLSLTSNGNIRYQLKTPYRDGTTGRRSDTGSLSHWISLPAWPHWYQSQESTLPGSMMCLRPTANIVPW